MLIPVRCFTCGLPLGDIAPVYEYIKAKRMSKKYGSLDSKKMPVSSSSDSGGELTDVLESFKLTKCCKTHIITAMIFYEHY